MRRYLIVDDNVAFAENLAEIVRDLGDDADTAENGRAALALVEKTRYHALVSDMRMPVMSGAELVHTIRRVDPGLPAIVVTAYTADDDLAAARREGLLAIFSKPVPLDRLTKTLADARRDGLVAIVEDDTALADNLSEALRARGLAAVTAASVSESDRLGVTPFCAIVDLRLPGGPDGEALRRMRARFPTLPTFVITAHDRSIINDDDARVFEKPFSTSELMSAVEAAWAKRA